MTNGEASRTERPPRPSRSVICKLNSELKRFSFLSCTGRTLRHPRDTVDFESKLAILALAALIHYDEV